jgi:hypothetical protein
MAPNATSLLSIPACSEPAVPFELFRAVEPTPQPATMNVPRSPGANGQSGSSALGVLATTLNVITIGLIGQQAAFCQNKAKNLNDFSGGHARPEMVAGSATEHEASCRFAT